MSYNIYLNVIKMIIKPEYRNMTLENTNIIDEKTYITDININGYISIKCKKEENEIFDTIFYILQKNSNIIRIVAEFKKHMNKISKNIKYVYLINNLEPSQQIIRLINQYNFNISILKHNVFMFEIPAHKEASKHEILNPDEINDLIISLDLIDKLLLPKIKIDDAQCIWIGAKSKDIIRIKRENGTSLYYRIVLGKIHEKIISYYNHKPNQIIKNYKQGEKITIKTKQKQKNIKEEKKKNNIKL